MDKRPREVIWMYWLEQIVIEEDSTVYEPIYLQEAA